MQRFYLEFDDLASVNLIDTSNAAIVSAWAEILGAAGSFATAFIALFVFREARRIGQLEWINNSNLIWNDFNKMLLERGFHKKWAEFFFDEKNIPEFFQYHREINWYIFCHLNILVTIIRTEKIRSYDDEYFRRILEAEFRLLYRRRYYVYSLMRETGYDPDLIRLFRDYCSRVSALVRSGSELDDAHKKVESTEWRNNSRDTEGAFENLE